MSLTVALNFISLLIGSAVNILLITPEKAIKLVANDYFCHLLQPEWVNMSVEMHENDLRKNVGMVH
jgi:hypothetical protein